MDQLLHVSIDKPTKEEIKKAIEMFSNMKSKWIDRIEIRICNNLKSKWTDRIPADRCRLKADIHTSTYWLYESQKKPEMKMALQRSGKKDN